MSNALPSNTTDTEEKSRSAQVRSVRCHEHLAKVFELLWTTDFLSEQGKLDDVEKFVVEFMCFGEVLLLHLLTHFAMLAVGRCIASPSVV